VAEGRLVSHGKDGTVRLRGIGADRKAGPPDHPYRVLDLEEYADATESGEIDVATGLDGLRRTQTFLDRHLNRRHDTRRDRWPDFPPRAIANVAGLPFAPHWDVLGK
jgi:hypothetical protein